MIGDEPADEAWRKSPDSGEDIPVHQADEDDFAESLSMGKRLG
jgi:hypothetical protein